MARFHLRFKNFRPAVIDAASKLFDAKPWRIEDLDERLTHAQTFVNEISAAYKTPTARVRITNDFMSDYEPAIVAVGDDDEIISVESPIISLGGWSILALFTATRVHLLANGVEAQGSHQYEDPQGWACSLFYTVKPAMFRARAREGRVPGVSARDTYTRESWAALVAQGKADNWNGTLIEAPDLSDLPPDSLHDDDDNLPDADEWDGEGFDEAHDDESISDEGDSPFQAVGSVVYDAETDDLVDGLDSLGIVALRKLSRGRVSGGYSLAKPALIAALRQAGVRA